jgi:Icc-related predicted phosphoesterase
MKILAIGDPHGDIKKIKKIPMKGVDLILLTGDIGKADLARQRFFENVKRKKEGLSELKEDAKFSKKVSMEIYDSTIKILKYLSRYASVYAITGNVWMSDKGVKKDEKRFKIKLPHLHEDFKRLKNFDLVRNSIRSINGLKVGFLEYFDDVCWYKEYNNKDKKRTKKARKQTKKVKSILRNFENLDILVCHQPPYGYLDKTNNSSAPKEWKGKHAGSKVILDYIKKYQPKYVFCGHIHEGEGKARIGKTEVYNLGVAEHKAIEL